MKPQEPRPLRHAASILVYLRFEPSTLLWVQRSSELAYAGGFHALPGGRVEPQDAGLPHDGGSHVAYRVAALRELFEETGILHVAGPPLSDTDRVELRADFRAGRLGAAAAKMSALGVRFATQSLTEAGRAVTPESAQTPTRFDTHYYALAVDEPVALDPELGELELAEWTTARNALTRWAAGEVLIDPLLASALRITARRGVDAAAIAGEADLQGRERLRWEVVPGLSLLPFRTPTLPPATHTNAFIVGTGRAVLVEPASPWPDQIELAARWVREYTDAGLEFEAILATHHHPDHIGGAVALSERLALPLWAHRLTAQRLDGHVQFARHIEDGETIELDGPTKMELTAVHTPGHAPGHLCFVERSSNAMIAGDMVADVGTILVEPEDGDMTLYLESLERMAQWEPSMLLPAHGQVIRNPQERLAHYREHRLWREQQVLRAVDVAAEPATVADLVPTAYSDADPQVWPLAQGSTEAHLLKLQREGKVRRVGDRWAR